MMILICRMSISSGYQNGTKTALQAEIAQAAATQCGRSQIPGERERLRSDEPRPISEAFALLDCYSFDFGKNSLAILRGVEADCATSCVNLLQRIPRA